MNHKLALTSIIVFAVILGISSMTPTMAAKNKVDLCHYSEEIIPGYWMIISISANGKAVNAHEKNHAQDNGDGSYTYDFLITNANPTVQAQNQAACDALISPPPEEFNVSIPIGTGTPGCQVTNECYLPPEINVNRGDIVTWTNDDLLAPHTVTSGVPGAHDGEYDSGFLSFGATFSYTYKDAGQFDYYCAYHPWMTGKVIVN